MSDCSGSLIRFEQSLATDQALILTNGHCLETGMPNAGQVITHQASNRTFDLMYSDPTRATATVTASEVVYSTMTKTDITVYLLTDTYASIQTKFGIQPFTLSAAHPALAQAINVISGYWQRGYSCSIEAFAYELKEDQWTWSDSMRYSRPGCDVIGGTSGSPVVAGGTRTVVGVNNTIKDGEQCTLDNPCEIDANGSVTFHEGYGYAQETYLIAGCLNAENQIDDSIEGCQLPR